MAKRASGDIRSASTAIINGQVEPADVYVLSGGDNYLSDLLIRQLSAHYVLPEDAEFNIDTIDCQDNPPTAALTNALVELPVMCDKRLLILLNAHCLKAEAIKAIAEAMQKNLPYHSNVVILTTTTSKKDSLAGQCLASSAYTTISYECELSENGREQWINHHLKELGLSASASIVRQIAERTGSDTQFLHTQLVKLCQYLGERTEITSSDVSAVIRKSIEIKSWELTDAIRRQDQRRALELVQDMLSDDAAHRAVDINLSNSDKGATPPANIRALGLLTYINSYLRTLAQVRHLAEQHGNDTATLAQLTGKKEFQMRKTLEEVDTWSEASLRTAFRALCLADYHIKTGRDHMMAIQLVVYRLCRRK